MSEETDSVINTYGTEFGRMSFDAPEDFSLSFESWGFVVYKKTIVAPDATKYTLYLYFPNQFHSKNHGGRSGITQAELAEMFLIYGKWNDWFRDELKVMIESNDIIGKLDSIVMSFYDDSLKETRKEYDRILKQKSSISQINTLKNKLKKATHLSVSTAKKMRDLRGLLSATSFDRKSWKAQEIEFKKIEIVGKKTKNQNIKNYEEYRRLSKEWGVYGNAKASDLYYIMSVVSMMPNVFGKTIEDAMNKAGKAAREYLIHSILGNKAPDIVDKTKYNRRSRGNSDWPPLNETGEFAKSLQYLVLTDRSY